MPWLRLALFGLWCAAAGALAGQFLPLNAVPRGAALIVLALLLGLGVLRAGWAVSIEMKRQRRDTDERE